MVLIDSAKKEIELKNNIVQGMLDSNKHINSAMSKVAEWIGSLGAGIVQGFGLLAQALSAQTNQNQQMNSYPVPVYGPNYQSWLHVQN